MSERTGISVKHLSSIERGLTFVSAELLEKLSEILEIPVYLFFIKETEILYNDAILNAVDKIVEENLIKAIEGIKTGIRKNDYGCRHSD